MTRQDQLAKLTRDRLDQPNISRNVIPFIYANSGFNSPSIPDMQDATLKSPSFIELEVSNSTYQVTVMQATKNGSEYAVQSDPNFSCETI